ncbi:DNA primase family protein [Pedobacter sp. UYEF25]
MKDCVDVTPEIIKVDPINHDVLIDNLLSKIERVNFRLAAFPEVVQLEKDLEVIEQQIIDVDGSFKKNVPAEILETYKLLNKNLASKFPKAKHYFIYTIEELQKVAIKNNWGICRSNDFVYLYNGAYWAVFDKDELKTFLSKVALRMGVDKSDAKFYKFIDELFKQFHFGANLPKPPQQMGTTLINLLNGTFEISQDAQILRAPERKDFLKYQLPFDYDPKATAPKFKSFLDKVLPDKECQTVLAEYLGYIFIQPNVLKLEKTLFCYGTGANGKSVLFEIVRALLGTENISNYSIQSLTDSTGYYRASLANKLLNYASEINGNLEASIFKQLVSGEPVEARLPYGQPFILTNYAKMIFNGNTLPKDVEHTAAYFRRFLIIPFNVTIPPHEQDKDLDKNIIANELPGVFNWVLEGLERVLKQRGFSKCDAAENMVSDYRQQSDTVALFVDDHHYLASTTETTALKTMHGEYKGYCIENGYKPCSNRVLADRLRNLGLVVERAASGNVVNAANRGGFGYA